MTVTYGFYDSVTGDRVYNAMQFSSLLDAIINNGVFASIGTALLVSAGSGLHVTVGIGRAWFDHTWTYNDSVLTLDITTPHAVLDRIDAVVVETNSDSGVRANSIKVIDGTPAASPVPPTLSHTSTLNQYPLAYILVVHSSTQILQANITNKVGTSDCPFVTGILETIDVDLLFAQWQDDFETWFQYLQDELDSNQAANLLALIMEHDHSDPLHTQVVTDGIEDAAISLVKLAADLRFQKIAEFVGNGTDVPDFTAIPQTFTHLLMIYSGFSTNPAVGSATIWFRVNGDSGNHYYSNDLRRDYLRDDWSANYPNTNGFQLGSIPYLGSGTYLVGGGLAVIMNYKSTALYKMCMNIGMNPGGAGNAGLNISYTYWNQLSAINRLTGRLTSANFGTGSIFSLYGFN